MVLYRSSFVLHRILHEALPLKKIAKNYSKRIPQFTRLRTCIFRLLLVSLSCPGVKVVHLIYHHVRGHVALEEPTRASHLEYVIAGRLCSQPPYSPAVANLLPGASGHHRARRDGHLPCDGEPAGPEEIVRRVRGPGQGTCVLFAKARLQEGRRSGHQHAGLSRVDIRHHRRWRRHRARKLSVRECFRRGANGPLLDSSAFGVFCGVLFSNFAARLKPDDITYIFDFAEVDSIVVDNEYISLLDDFKKAHPKVTFIVDTVSCLLSRREC